MKVFLVIILIFGGVLQCFADNINLNSLMPKIQKAVDKISKNNYATAKMYGKIDVNEMTKLLHNAKPALLSVSSSFFGNAKNLKKVIAAISKARQDENSTGIFLQVSDNILKNVVNVVGQLATLFNELTPQLTDFASDLTKHLKPMSVTPNGYLKVPKTFLSSLEHIETTISTLNFDISNQLLNLEGDLQSIENDLNSSELAAKVPDQFLTDINNLLESSSNAYLAVGTEVRSLVTSIRSVRSIFKKTKKGTCIYISIKKFIPIVANGTKQIAQTYTTLGNKAAKLNTQLGQLQDYLTDNF